MDDPHLVCLVDRSGKCLDQPGRIFCGRGVPSSRSARLPPSMYSIAKNGRPSKSPKEKIWTMCGWWIRNRLGFSKEAACRFLGGVVAGKDHLERDNSV